MLRILSSEDRPRPKVALKKVNGKRTSDKHIRM